MSEQLLTYIWDYSNPSWAVEEVTDYLLQRLVIRICPGEKNNFGVIPKQLNISEYLRRCPHLQEIVITCFPLNAEGCSEYTDYEGKCNFLINLFSEKIVSDTKIFVEGPTHGNYDWWVLINSEHKLDVLPFGKTLLLYSRYQLSFEDIKNRIAN